MHAMNWIWKTLDIVSTKLRIVGAFSLGAMMLLTCADVVGRLFKHPVYGSVEVVSLLGVFVVASTLPFTHLSKGHIGVELVFRYFPRRAKFWVDTITGLLSLAVYGLVAWRMFDYASEMKASGEVSMNLQLPEYLIIFAAAICFGIFFIAILKGIKDNYDTMRKK